MTRFIAHRGAHEAAPENSLDAFARALALGFEAVELDVHATADGVVVVHHDEWLATPTGPLPVREATAAAVFASAPHVPSLADVLALLGTRAAAYVEIKGRDMEEHAARVLADAPGPVAIHSFDHEIVRRMRQLLPHVPAGILQASRLVDSVHALRAAGATTLWQWHAFVDATLVAQVRRAGGEVIVWTSNSPGAWPALRAMGVAGICTDLAPPAPTPTQAALS